VTGSTGCFGFRQGTSRHQGGDSSQVPAGTKEVLSIWGATGTKEVISAGRREAGFCPDAASVNAH